MENEARLLLSRVVGLFFSDVNFFNIESFLNVAATDDFNIIYVWNIGQPTVLTK